jgi:hypothetical protein
MKPILSAHFSPLLLFGNLYVGRVVCSISSRLWTMDNTLCFEHARRRHCSGGWVAKEPSVENAYKNLAVWFLSYVGPSLTPGCKFELIVTYLWHPAPNISGRIADLLEVTSTCHPSDTNTRTEHSAVMFAPYGTNERSRKWSVLWLHSG